MAKKKSNPVVELQEFSMSKTLKASKISSIVKGREGSATIVIESDKKGVDPLKIEVDRHFLAKHSPRSGGYFTSETVELKGDGDQKGIKEVIGFISAEDFEANYSPVVKEDSK